MDFKNDNSGLEPDDDQALWELLGRARSAEPSSYFVRRVLRDLEADAEEAAGSSFGGWLAWLRPGWIVAGGAALVVAAAGLLTFSFLPGELAPAVVRQSVAATPSFVAVAPSAAVSRSTVVADPAAQAPTAESAAVFHIPADVRPQDVDVIADLDNLVAREETNAWTDDTSRF